MQETMRKPATYGGIAVMCAATLIFGTQLAAQHGPGGADGRFGRGPGGGLVRGLQELSLSDAQRAEIRTIIESSRESGMPLREQLRETRRALRDAVTSDTVNESEIRALAAQMAPLEAEAAVQRARTHSAMMAVLTPDQRDELHALREEARERVRERIERRREQRRRPR